MMTDQEINIAIAEAHDRANLFAIEKGSYYYRQGGHGYTQDLAHAGRYTKEQAERELVRGEPMRIVPIPHPDYCHDLNAMHDVILSIDDPHRRLDYVANLMTGCGYRETYMQGLADFSVVNATARQRAEAFLRVKGLWKE